MTSERKMGGEELQLLYLIDFLSGLAGTKSNCSGNRLHSRLPPFFVNIHTYVYRAACSYRL